MHAYAVYIWNYLDISTCLISQEISPLSIIVPQKMMKSPFVALGSIQPHLHRRFAMPTPGDVDGWGCSKRCVKHGWRIQ